MVSKFLSPGVYKINQISVTDNLSNQYTYYNSAFHNTTGQSEEYEYKDFSAYDVTIFGTVGPDKTPPTLQSLNVSTQHAIVEDKIMIVQKLSIILLGLVLTTLILHLHRKIESQK